VALPYKSFPPRLVSQPLNATCELAVDGADAPAARDIARRLRNNRKSRLRRDRVTTRRRMMPHRFGMSMTGWISRGATTLSRGSKRRAAQDERENRANRARYNS